MVWPKRSVYRAGCQRGGRTVGIAFTRAVKLHIPTHMHTYMTSSFALSGTCLRHFSLCGNPSEVLFPLFFDDWFGGDWLRVICSPSQCIARMALQAMHKYNAKLFSNVIILECVASLRNRGFELCWLRESCNTGCSNIFDVFDWRSKRKFD
jgi:hypothetical protein